MAISEIRCLPMGGYVGTDGAAYAALKADLSQLEVWSKIETTDTTTDGATTYDTTTFYLSDTLYFVLDNNSDNNSDAWNFKLYDSYGNTVTVATLTSNTRCSNWRFYLCNNTVAMAITYNQSSTGLTAYPTHFSCIISTITYEESEYPCVIYNKNADSSTYIYSDLRSGVDVVYNYYADTKFNSAYGASFLQMTDPLLGCAPIANVFVPQQCNIAAGEIFTLNGDEYVRSSTLVIGGA